jgi:alanyl aminopeptidase
MQITRIVLALAGMLFFTSVVMADESAVFRLPQSIQPIEQAIELKLDPNKPDYSGRTIFQLNIKEDVDQIGIYQIGIEMSVITLKSASSSRTLEATEADYDINWLADGKTIPAGQYELSIDFSGMLSTDSLGMHSSRFEGNHYIFTQFESMYARKAIPTFDEPSFKIPYQLTISAPEGLTVVSNTPVASESTEDGWQHVEFMQTRPLPSYLIAYAVGPLDRAEIKGMSVPGYIYTPVGHADELGFVLGETANIVGALEDYFGVDYPFRKLDFIAVPEFAFGAMENPGLITYRTDLLLLGDNPTGRTAALALSVIAHEVAHIWYGDLVTMAWWNDLWLNESFASWMAGKIIHQLYPKYETDLDLPQETAFIGDQRTSVKPIRKTVRSEADTMEGAGLAYSKGETVLRMLEHYVGADAWQRGTRSYIKKFSWTNATEKDLWAVMSEESGLDVGKIARDYLNQPGYAILDIDKNGDITQQRYLAYGLEAPDLQWHIPLNVKYKKNDKVQETFYMLSDKSGTIDLPDNADWIMPDSGGNGYFRWRTDIDQFYALVDDLDALENREKIALLDNSDALLSARELSLDDYMYVMKKMLHDPHPLVALQAINKVKLVGDQFVGPDEAEAFARFIDAELSDRFAEVGMESQTDENEALLQMRPRLLRVLGQYGADSDARKAAALATDQYLNSEDSVDGNLAVEALRVTSLNDDGGRYKKYVSTYLESTSADQQSTILASTYFRDLETVNAHLDFVISDAVPAGDGISGLRYYSAILSDHTVIYEWLEENIDALEAKIPSYLHAVLPQILSDGCNDTNRSLMIGFFGDRGEKYAVSLGKATETFDTCIARRKRDGDALMEFLAQYD